MPIKQYQGPGTPERFFQFAGGKDNYYPPYHIVDSSYGNLLRNPGFESWPDGVSFRPACWWLTSNGGTATRTTSEYQGAYALQMVKHEGDGDLNWAYAHYPQYGMIGPGPLVSPNYTPPCYDWVYQDVKGHIGDSYDELPWTLSGLVKTDTAMHARLFCYDGVEIRYGDWHTGSDDWEMLWVTYKPLETRATMLRVGVEFGPITGSDVTTLVDNMMFSQGMVPHLYQPNPDEHNPICAGFNYSGTWLPLHGCYRLETLYVTGTTSATPHTHSYTLHTGCRYIMHVSLNLKAFAGNNALASLRAQNYSTSGFDIIIEYYGTMGSWAYTIDGVVHFVGWDTSTELYD